MKKETIADKLARKSFESAAFQKSWQVHMQAFGPILEPAFPGDYQSRVHLAAALNKLSTRDIKGALVKLKPLQQKCETNADKAAWSFFVGLCFEMAGAKDQMLSMYQDAATFGHSFYLPYMKTAKAAHQDAIYASAEADYRKAIACLEGKAEDPQSKLLLASAWSNLASCLIMMHELSGAEQALEKSKAVLAEQPGRNATEAMLRAAMGQREQVEAILAAMEKENLTLAVQVRRETEKILTAAHPHFHRIPFDTEPLDAFWAWFEKTRPQLEKQMSVKDYNSVIAALNEALKPLAPFMEREPEFGIQIARDKYCLELADFYMASLGAVYEELINRMPEAAKDSWDVTVIH